MSIKWLLLVVLCAGSRELFEGKEFKTQIEVGSSQKYQLKNLAPSAKYEVRVSYLGTVGGNLKLEWDCSTSFRRLLDTEKLVFSTNLQREVQEVPCSQLVVKASRNSRGISKQLEEAPIHYSIQMERYFAGVPKSVLPMITAVLMLLGVSVGVYLAILKIPNLVKSD